MFKPRAVARKKSSTTSQQSSENKQKINVNDNIAIVPPANIKPPISICCSAVVSSVNGLAVDAEGTIAADKEALLRDVLLKKLNNKRKLEELVEPLSKSDIAPPGTVVSDKAQSDAAQLSGVAQNPTVAKTSLTTKTESKLSLGAGTENDGYFKVSTASSSCVPSQTQYIAHRYRVVRELGKGMFASVVLCEDTAAVVLSDNSKKRTKAASSFNAGTASSNLVAIKILRQFDTPKLQQSMKKEVEILHYLNSDQPYPSNDILEVFGASDGSDSINRGFEMVDRDSAIGGRGDETGMLKGPVAWAEGVVQPWSEVRTSTYTHSTSEVAAPLLHTNTYKVHDGSRPTADRKHALSRLHHFTCLFESFVHSQHMCLVMRYYPMTLRSLMRISVGHRQQHIHAHPSSSTKGKPLCGLHLSVIQSFGRQLLKALRYVHSKGLIHCDVKLDNILVNENMSVVTLCDFGSAVLQPEYMSQSMGEAVMKMPSSGREQPGASQVFGLVHNEYVAARYFRAPEVILGYLSPLSSVGGSVLTPGVDVWALGCTLSELYGTTVLFAGATNNDMLWHYMCRLEVPFDAAYLENSKSRSAHFTSIVNVFTGKEELYFLKKAGPSSTNEQKDAVNCVCTPIRLPIGTESLIDHAPICSLADYLKSPGTLSKEKDKANSSNKEDMDFFDLLHKHMFVYCPAHRVSAAQALSHPFFSIV